MSPGAEAMLRAIRRDFQELRWRLPEAGLLDNRVARALLEVPRDAFVPAGADAWENRPQEIDCGQTVSQPFIVALMTQLALPLPTSAGVNRPILEVGAGSGYQAAVLAALGVQVLSIERHASLVEQTVERLAKLGIGAVTVRLGDGSKGWAERAPFERILVTAGAARVPAALLEQLAPGGHMVIPVGPQAGNQQLCVFRKDRHGTVHEQRVLPVRFVPLVEES